MVVEGGPGHPRLDLLLSSVGSAVLVEGGAGMGKSRFLGEVAAMAAACP
jgi:hypothetical protein